MRSSRRQAVLHFWRRVRVARSERGRRGLPIYKVAVVCECSQVIADLLNLAGNDAFSVDTQLGRGFSPHKVMDVHEFLDSVDAGLVCLDKIIAHPPCRLLSNLAKHHFAKGRHSRTDRARALGLVTRLIACTKRVPELYVENPAASSIASRHGVADVVCSPWEFGANYDKLTG
jgi:hypothetical protein